MSSKYQQILLLFFIIIITITIPHPVSEGRSFNTEYTITYRALLSTPYQDGYKLCGVIHAHYVYSNNNLILSSILISEWRCSSPELEKILKALLQPEEAGARRIGEEPAGDPVVIFGLNGSQSYVCTKGEIIYYTLNVGGKVKEIYMSVHRSEAGAITWASAYFLQNGLGFSTLVLQPLGANPVPSNDCFHPFPDPTLRAGLITASILVTALAIVNTTRFTRKTSY